MSLYRIEFEYTVPEFATVTVETDETDIEKIEKLAYDELESLFPEAVDPEIISWFRTDTEGTAVNV
jgi:hypothetical protein